MISYRKVQTGSLAGFVHETVVFSRVIFNILTFLISSQRSSFSLVHILLLSSVFRKVYIFVAFSIVSLRFFAEPHHDRAFHQALLPLSILTWAV